MPWAMGISMSCAIGMRYAATMHRLLLPTIPRDFEREAAPQPALSSRPGDRHLFVTAFGADAKGNIAALTQRIVAARANISASKVRARARRNRPTRAALATPPTLLHSR